MLENLKNILESINLTFNDIVKTSMFLSSLINFQAFNLVYERYFNKNPPIRTTIQTGPMNGVLVEIDVVAKKS
jgi:enamine deaminase RidA (YjgF/YER057c/UK114 family)